MFESERERERGWEGRWERGGRLAPTPTPLSTSLLRRQGGVLRRRRRPLLQAAAGEEGRRGGVDRTGPSFSPARARLANRLLPHQPGPRGDAETAFYQHVQAALAREGLDWEATARAARGAARSQPPFPPASWAAANAPLLAALPIYHGIVDRPAGGVLLALEDVAGPCRHPCVADIKIGASSAHPDDPPARVAQCAAKRGAAVQAALGFRLCGARVSRTRKVMVNHQKMWALPFQTLPLFLPLPRPTAPPHATTGAGPRPSAKRCGRAGRGRPWQRGPPAARGSCPLPPPASTRSRPGRRRRPSLRFARRPRCWCSTAGAAAREGRGMSAEGRRPCGCAISRTPAPARPAPTQTFTRASSRSRPRCGRPRRRASDFEGRRSRAL